MHLREREETIIGEDAEEEEKPSSSSSAASSFSACAINNMAPYTPPPVSKKARARDKELMASLGSRVESERRERLQSTVDDENWMRGAAAAKQC